MLAKSANNFKWDTHTENSTSNFHLIAEITSKYVWRNEMYPIWMAMKKASLPTDLRHPLHHPHFRRKQSSVNILVCSARKRILARDAL